MDKKDEDVGMVKVLFLVSMSCLKHLLRVTRWIACRYCRRQEYSYELHAHGTAKD